MNNNLIFHSPLIPSLQNKVDTAYWDTVLKLYEEKNYTETVRGVIRYLNPEMENKNGNPGKTRYEIPHGSIIVNIEIGEEKLKIDAPFLSVTGSKLVPLLRQASQINFSPLTLSNIYLQNEQLHFIYECPLDLCEPLKVYDILREICINADNYDDEFISKFNAVRINEPRIRPYDPAKTEKAWEITQQYILEAATAYEQLESKRLNQFLWDLLVITLLKIDLLCAPQGNLRGDIEKNIAYLNSKDDYYQRLNSGREFLKRLQTMPKENFIKDLYAIDVFVPYKYFTNADGVRSQLKYAYETASNERKANDHMGAVFTMAYGILLLFYNNTVEETVASILIKALENSSGKLWPEASQILYDALHEVMTNKTLQKKRVPEGADKRNESKKGFFEKLFGI